MSSVWNRKYFQVPEFAEGVDDDAEDRVEGDDGDHEEEEDVEDGDPACGRERVLVEILLHDDLEQLSAQTVPDERQKALEHVLAVEELVLHLHEVVSKEQEPNNREYVHQYEPQNSYPD